MGLSRCTIGFLVASLSACAPRLPDLIADRHYAEALQAADQIGDAAQSEQLVDALMRDIAPQVHISIGQLAGPNKNGVSLSVLRVRVAGNRPDLSGDLLHVENLTAVIVPAELKSLAARAGERVPECYDYKTSDAALIVGTVASLLTLGILSFGSGDRRICPSQAEWNRALPLALAMKAQLHHGCEPPAQGKNLQCTFDFLLPPSLTPDSQSSSYGPIPLSFRFEFAVRRPETRRRIGSTFSLTRRYELTLPSGPELAGVLAERFGAAFRPLHEAAQRR